MTSCQLWKVPTNPDGQSDFQYHELLCTDYVDPYIEYMDVYRYSFVTKAENCPDVDRLNSVLVVGSYWDPVP